MDQSLELSLEQQFSLRTFADEVQHLSREQAQAVLVDLRKQMMLRENMYLDFLKHDWGLEPGSPSF